MPRSILVANGEIHNSLFKLIKPSDYVVGVDRGAFTLLEKNFRVDLAIGDFDSVSENELELIKNNVKKIKIFPTEKDFTDTELALKEIIKKGRREIIIFGAMGRRSDHTLANIFLLERYQKEGIKIKIIDDHSVIEVVNKQTRVSPDPNFKYISFIPLTDEVSITLSGFKFNLKNRKVKRGMTLCLSNELLKRQGKVLTTEGFVLMVKSKD